MDPLTHAISGAALARAIPRHHLPPLQLIFLVLLTMAPDADIVLRFFSDAVYLQHHRGLTHSLLMIPLWGWLAYSLSSQRIKANRAMPWLIGAALFMHIMLDLITTFGTMIVAPSPTGEPASICFLLSTPSSRQPCCCRCCWGWSGDDTSARWEW